MSTVGFQKMGAVVAALVAAVALVAGAAPAARAQAKGAPAGAVSFGSVNVEQVLKESKARQRDEAELNQMISGLRNVVGLLQEKSARFLSEAEIKELAGIYEKPADKLTEAEKKRRQALEDQALLKSANKQKIENNPNPSEDDRKRYAEINDSEQKGNQALKALSDDYAARVDSRNADLSNATVNQIRGIIAKIAQDKGISVVFDSRYAIYSANDITAEVVKQLNK